MRNRGLLLIVWASAALISDCGSEEKLFPSAQRPGASAPGVDLIVDPKATLESIEFTERTFTENDCAIMEGCIGGTGTRRLIRFDAMTENLGTEDLILGPPENNPAFGYSACHKHYHFGSYLAFELIGSGTSAPVATGRKQGFCLNDSIAVIGDKPRKFACDNQGITAGWADIYVSGLDCQWLDITDVPPGKYKLRLTVNPDQTLPEARFDNNSAEVPVEIPADTSR